MSTTTRSVQHDTIVIERSFDASPAQVFTAFADVEFRKRWAVPRGDQLEYEQSDFSVGGRDLFRCGSPGNLCFHGDVRYEDIVPGQRIVYIENMSDEQVRLFAGLITAEFFPDNKKTNLRLTLQLASFDGCDMATGCREGYLAVLDNLAQELAR